MQIPENIMTAWVSLRSKGDAGKMADMLPGSDKETFNRAFRTASCRDEVFDVMSKFYTEKMNKISESLSCLIPKRVVKSNAA